MTIQLIMTEIREFESEEQFKAFFKVFKNNNPLSSTFYYDVEKKGEAFQLGLDPGTKTFMTFGYKKIIEDENDIKRTEP